ncbi:uncharacterized protein LOC129294852 [Prosopis cineraria]|uniref:uncharacterized protein LOC129294852 n=1 Tax=Prosopis cineraria TaxID=364024 RepID=UPI00240FFB5A|nr:uncharacterized protein LOC129294852 [Prosopis cineraria]
MKGTSKVIMGATLVMVITLAVVLGLILVLLAELYCSLLLRRRRRRRLRNAASRANASSPSSPSLYPQHQSPLPLHFGGIYAHGVLQAPRTLLFPSLAHNDDAAGPKLQHSELLQIETQESVSHPHHQIGLLSAFPPPALSLTNKATPKLTQEITEQGSISGAGPVFSDNTNSGGEHLVYISNPIYENDEAKCSSGADTSFETPDTSPSRLERSGSSGDDDDDEVEAVASGSPALSPMKKLPAEACSVSLSNGRPLATSGSDSHSINGPSSSSSASPCTSPSW